MINVVTDSFFLSSMVGGVIYDFVKYGAQVSIEYLKDKITNISLSEEELEKLKNLINESAKDKENLESLEKFTHKIENDNFYKEIANKYKESMLNIVQNVNGNNNDIAGRDINKTINNYYSLDVLPKK